MVDPKAQDIQILNKKRLADGFFKIDSYTLRVPHYDGTLGAPIEREVADRGNAAGVLLYDPDREEMIFVEQFRPGAFFAKDNPWMFECVAGIIDAGETGADVAVREAIEEAGCTVTDLEFALSYYSSPGGMTERIDVYCGRVDSAKHAQIGGLAAEGEDIRIRTVSVGDMAEMVRTGKINNALTLIACQWFLLNRNNLAKKWGEKS